MKVRARNGPDASAWRYRQACMTEIATLQRECRSRASGLPTHGASARHCSRENCKFRAISVGQIARLTLGDVAGDEHQRAVRPGCELRNRDAKADAVEMESARAATAVCSLPHAPRACPLPANINLINPGRPGLIGGGEHTESVASSDQDSGSDSGIRRELSPPWHRPPSSRRQREMKHRAARRVVARPYVAAMRFDDRPADRQSHPPCRRAWS